MHFPSIKDLIYSYRDDIVQEMNHRLSQVLRSSYKEFILLTEEGRRRLNTWVNLVIRSLEGDIESFLIDQERVGYSRAVQGFKLEDVSEIYHVFCQVLLEILQKAVAKKNIELLDLFREMQELNEILFKGYRIIAASFLKTREELINEKLTYLQELYNFTYAIISGFGLKEIVDLTLVKIAGLLGMERAFLAIYRNQQIQGIYSNPPNQDSHRFRIIMESTVREGIPLFMDDQGEIYKNIDQSPLKCAISIPIQAHGHCHGILILGNNKTGFRFTSKELELLYQFIYIVAEALENAFMLDEIEQSRHELRLLTGEIITIQEEERKRLAIDIHDTVAQALTGINFKIQFCKELFKKSPELIIDQFNDLLKMVHNAMDQSRQLISSLRPDFIDNMGLVLAIKHYINNFVQETGIRVTANLPKQVQIPSELSICLFRVAQEALMNVYKHAETKSAKLMLQEKDGYIILVVGDSGKGFDMTLGPYRTKDQNKLGLISMKERVGAVGGALFISAGINQGCRVEAKIPLMLRMVGHNG